jgi:hypothetical protein
MNTAALLLLFKKKKISSNLELEDHHVHLIIILNLHTNTKKIKVMPSGIATWQVKNQIEIGEDMTKAAELIHPQPRHKPDTKYVHTHTTRLLTKQCACSTTHTHSSVCHHERSGLAVDQGRNGCSYINFSEANPNNCIDSSLTG